MTHPAPILSAATRSYRGAITDPARWSVWAPRKGDILVCTPPKCGTTWTQSILAMLVHGSADLPGPVPVLSPWIDADLGVPAEDVAAVLAAQEGRRVVKTHTPADGFPVWEGVTVISVYRHPLDVFFSLRKHIENTKVVRPNHPMDGTVSEAFGRFVRGGAQVDDFDEDTLATFATHYTETVGSGRLPDLKLFHYSDMVRDGRRAVVRLAEAAEIPASAALIDEVAEATSFASMKAKASDYVPVGGTGYWKSDAGFFDSASSAKWEGQLSGAELQLFDTRFAELVPDADARRWLVAGEGTSG